MLKLLSMTDFFRMSMYEILLPLIPIVVLMSVNELTTRISIYMEMISFRSNMTTDAGVAPMLIEIGFMVDGLC